MKVAAAWRVLITVLVVGIVAIQFSQYRVLERIAETMSITVAGNSLTTSWKSGGIVRTVTTTRNLGETDKELLIRHAGVVAEELQLHPIDQE